MQTAGGRQIQARGDRATAVQADAGCSFVSSRTAAVR